MNICFIPIDNRPVCYNLAEDIAAIDKSINIFLPPREYLGDLTKNADINSILDWFNNSPRCDSLIIALDTIAYGGLIPSRRSNDTPEEIKTRIDKLISILKEKQCKVYAFSSIMRISNNNYNEEEKEYWSEYGKKIFEYSFSGGKKNDGIPKEIIQDYLNTRKRNFEINKYYLECGFDTLIFSKDDCAEFGFNVDEAHELENLGATTKTGADEIPLTLLARAIEKEINVYVEFTEAESKNLISNYEDVSIEKSVEGQLALGGFNRVFDKNKADLILYVNNFLDKQGELVMDWSTKPFDKEFTAPNKPYAIADVRYANGADNKFVEAFFEKLDDNFYGYAGWNTSANTLGSLLAGVKVRYNASKYNKKAFERLQIIRFLDDWAYQANVRRQIDKPCDIKDLMKPFEDMIFKKFNTKYVTKYIYPWKRKFEIEICLE